MSIININEFKNVGFYLNGKVKVDSLENGATIHGGATKFDNGIYANIEGNDEILVNMGKNELTLVIPSTINGNIPINNTPYVEKYYHMIENEYSSNNMVFYKTQGSWYSDKKEVVVENVTLISLNIEKITVNDIKYFLSLGNMVKNDMKQEGVSVFVNDALMIV